MGLTHSISYYVITTTCTVLASAAQANTTPMQKPNSATGQACLSFTVLSAHNILPPVGVTSRIALQSLCLWYSDRNVSLSALKLQSFRAFVLLYCCIDICTKRNTDECGEFAYVANLQFRHIFFRHALVYKYSDRSPIRALDQATATQTAVITLSCKRLSTRQQNREKIQIYLNTKKNLQSLGILQSLPWETRRSQTNTTSTQMWSRFGTCGAPVVV